MSKFWRSNLKALGSRSEVECRRLATLLAERGPTSQPGGISRSGMALPGVTVAGGVRPLISTFDPLREAQRWAETTGPGTWAVFGGGGVQAAQALLDRGASLVFWVEPRTEVWQSLLTWEDWSAVLVQESWLPVADPAESWAQLVRNRYHPLWDGAFRTIEWRAAVQGCEALWDDHRQITREVLDDWTTDASTQARFGERWYRNTLTNLKRMTPASVPPCPGRTVVVAGAGPSLADTLDDPAQRSWLDARAETGDRLFSTDTALPALTARGVVPDLVLCLDGQLPSYHHFHPPLPAIPLVADLASVPVLARLGLTPVRFLSGHPFGAVVRRYFPEIPALDGSLGQVSGLGLTLARALGASQVVPWGVDFSYRDGQSYARGTYVYDLAARSATRTAPMETRLTAFYGAAGLERTFDLQGRTLMTTPLLRNYRQRWESAPMWSHPVVLAHGGNDRWPLFREHWKNRLVSLPWPPKGRAFHPFVQNLEPDRQVDWYSLWPLALSLHRQGPTDNLLSRVVERALSFLED